MRIHRIMADPEGFDRAVDGRGRHWGAFINLDQEYVELLNDASDPADIGGWRIADSSGHVYIFPVGTIVQPGATIRVRSGQGVNSGSDLFWNRRAPVWNNREDTATLFDGDGAPIGSSLTMAAVETSTVASINGFMAQTHSVGPAIELLWQLPDPEMAPDNIPLQILRRQRRYPGRTRRGIVPVAAQVEDLTDGQLIYDTSIFEFDFEEKREEAFDNLFVCTTYQYLYRGHPQDRCLVRSIRREHDPDTGTCLRTVVRYIDRAELTAGDIYYYTAFIGEQRLFSTASQASALATGEYGHCLFDAVPMVDKQLDTVKPEPFSVARVDREKGQLQRFLAVMDAHTDMSHGSIAGHLDLHNARRADSRLLPAMAHMVGWDLKDYLDEDGQRNEILFASQVYKTVGTLPNIAAMVNRLTGWDAQVREFAVNIVVSFDSARVETLASGQRLYLDGHVALNPSGPPTFNTHTIPVGTVDTTDADAMYRLRTNAYEDTTAHSYDCGWPDGQGDYERDNDTWYNRETIGIYIVPDVDSEPFTLIEEWARVRQVLAKFLPVQVRAVFVLQPGVVVEEEYNAVTMVVEAYEDLGVLVQDEHYGEGSDSITDHIPGWHWFFSNDPDHRTVDVLSVEVDTGSRTWHTGLD